jgi:hypothetical protein
MRIGGYPQGLYHTPWYKGSSPQTIKWWGDQVVLNNKERKGNLAIVSWWPNWGHFEHLITMKTILVTWYWWSTFHKDILHHYQSCDHMYQQTWFCIKVTRNFAFEY